MDSFSKAIDDVKAIIEKTINSSEELPWYGIIVKNKNVLSFEGMGRYIERWI